MMTEDGRKSPMGLFLLLGAAVLIGGAIYLRSGGGGEGEAPAGFIAGSEIGTAVDASRESGKPMFVVASATWCGPCQSYKASTLTDGGTAEMLTARTVPVYIDVDTDQEALEFLQRSGAQFQGIPFTAMIRDGRVVDSFTGPSSPDQLSQWVAEKAGRG